MNLNSACIDPSWRTIYQHALDKVDADYLQQLSQQTDWLPGPQRIFNALSQPLANTRYVLLGESPYPRLSSANGYAFWDAAVTSLWSTTGLHKSVNRATSLRNFLKMLLVAEGKLQEDTSQPAIARVDKSAYIQTNNELFANMLARGFLLLNASLVLSNKPVKQDAQAWHGFLIALLEGLAEYAHQQQQNISLLLFGNIAKTIHPIADPRFTRLICEHPYNLSFIHNAEVLDFFRPLNLLKPSNYATIPL